MNAYANMNTRSIQNRTSIQSKANVNSGVSEKEKEAASKDNQQYRSSSAKPGSMMEKANMVREYNERNNK